MNKTRLTYTSKSEDVDPSGNWNTAKDWFPTINVDQESRMVAITTYETSGRQKKASVTTEECTVEVSRDGLSMFVRGTVHVSNWINRKCGGAQSFCFAIFVGDSDHVYIHRAPATKGWMQADPDTIKKRLRKLGIGADRVIQQGDYLLKPANGNALDDADFKHEYMGSGHHKFDVPVLRAWSGNATQILISEPVTLRHTATDGIQHPDVIVPPGKYIIGTTANSLRHDNRRD